MLRSQRADGMLNDEDGSRLLLRLSCAVSLSRRVVNRILLESRARFILTSCFNASWNCVGDKWLQA